MTDELQEKKPKPIGTPAPNVSKPKSQPAPAPKQQLLSKSENSKVGNVKVKPGSPFKSESVPVGVQQKPLESQKHVEKRVDKMFKDTNQPTLGVWNKNNTHPMSDPDSIRFNPNLKYKPTKEQIQAANRKRIMNAGFAPKSSEERSKLLPPTDSRQFSSDELNKIGSTNVGFDKNKSYAYDVVKTGDKYHVKGYRNTENNWPSEDDMEDIEFKDANGNSIDGFNSFDEALEAMNKGGYPVYDNLKGQEKKETPNPFKQNPMPGFEGMDNLWDNMSKSGQKVIDNNKEERAKASELFGTDLNNEEKLRERYPWLPDKNYQEPEGFKSADWLKTDLSQKSDDDLVKMHDNLSKKLWNLKNRSPEEDDLQSRIEREYLKRHPVVDEDEDVEEEKSSNLNPQGENRQYTNDDIAYIDKEEADRNINDDIGGRGFEMPNGDFLGVELKDGKLYAGSPTNSGIMQDYYIDYDYDKSLYNNLEDLYTRIERGYPTEPSGGQEPVPQPQQPAWDKNNEPGSGVTTKELEEFVREQMKKDGDLNDNFIDAYVRGLHSDSKQADFWKQKMKDAFNGGNK